MVQLTKAEEQIMHILWQLQESTVNDIREKFEDIKPARTTVATVLSILENKEFVTHKSFGRVNVYYPVVAKNEYSKNQLLGMMKNYFNDSLPAMISCFVKENNLSIEALDKLLEETRKELWKEQKGNRKWTH